jgi:DNA-binding beta-propeller fold protein YncE
MVRGITFDPTHDRMYVANMGNDTVSVIDTNTNTVVGLPLVTGSFPAITALVPLQP